jgi:MFS superfamily sulfate permease-like transporter
MERFYSMFSFPRQDAIAGTVVFLVSLPLCLGIAIACGMPPISGLLTGVIGGLVAPLISRAPLAVTGPAAGLTSVVLVEIALLGGLPQFLTAVSIAGVIQTLLGVFRLGRFSAIVPAAVIKGMLVSIGITIIVKQLPVALGSKAGPFQAMWEIHPGALLITVLSLVILYGWKKAPIGRVQFLPAALVAVLVAAFVSSFLAAFPGLALHDSEFVSIPGGGLGELWGALPRPDWTILSSSTVWISGLTIALVASMESLLSLQAIDRLDPFKRHSPPDRELIAQGVTCALSGLVGGLPVTAVIVRSGANVAAGGRERLSALVNGLWLLMAVLFLGTLLNRIPLACLAAILIHVGLSLCKPALFTEQKRLGIPQFLPFVVTIVAVLAMDLLKGVIVGIVAGVIFVLYQYVRGALVRSVEGDGSVLIRFRRDATFLVKPAMMDLLDELDDGARVTLDATDHYVDQDIKEALVAFLEDAQTRKLEVTLRGIELSGVGSGGGH